jgi:CMP-N,N'-diacetyllegionaminic acid synthase
LKVLGLIPARKGSKRLPGKNTKILRGKSLIQYTYEAAEKSKYLDKVILSTDSISIAETARNFPKINVPFIRPSELASDRASDNEVMSHALNFLAEKGEQYDLLVYLRPTSPFKTASIIDQVVSKMISEPELTGVRTVTEVNSVSHPYWMYKKEHGLLVDFCSEGGVNQYYQSQLLPECFRLNGVVDCLKTFNLGSGSLYGEKVGSIVLDEHQSVDIDTNFDFLLAETLLGKN